MPEPRPENGHLRMPNEVVERLARLRLNGTQWQILWSVWRKTLCWQRSGEWKNDPYPISFGDLAKATGLNRQQIARETKALIERNILKRQLGHRKGLISFNLDYSSWVLAKRLPRDSVSENAHRAVDETATNGVGENAADVVAKTLTPSDTKTYLGKKPQKNIKKRKQTTAANKSQRDSRVREILNAISRKVGYQIPHYAKEGAAVKRALCIGYTPGQFIACWDKMKGFAFWQGRWLPLAKVTENLGEFVAGRLEEGRNRGQKRRVREFGGYPQENRTHPAYRGIEIIESGPEPEGNEGRGPPV